MSLKRLVANAEASAMKAARHADAATAAANTCQASDGARSEEAEP